MPAAILVVHPDAGVRSEMTATLRGGGYDVAAAATFHDATASIAERPPDLIITTVRLGAFNGLHLVLRGQAAHGQMAAVVLADPTDRTLAADASRLGAVLILAPLKGRALLATVARALSPSVT